MDPWVELRTTEVPLVNQTQFMTMSQVWTWLTFRRDSLSEGVADLVCFSLCRCARNAVCIKVHIWTCYLAFNKRGFCTHACRCLLRSDLLNEWTHYCLFLKKKKTWIFFLLNISQSSILILSSNGFSISHQITL